MLRSAAIIAVAALALACKPAKIGAGGSETEPPKHDLRAPSTPDRAGGKPANEIKAVHKEAKPNASNTGPSNPGNLVPWPYGSTYLNTPGAVYENFTLNGCIEIDANNVTLRNFVINCGGNYGIKQYNGHQGNLFEDGEITGNFESAGILGLGFTARRLYIHHARGDAIKAQGSTPGQTLVEASFIHCMGIKPDGFPVVDPHTDAVQIEGIQSHPGMTFRGNNFDMRGSPTTPPPECPNAPQGNGVIEMSDGNTNIVYEDGWVNGGGVMFSVDNAGLTVRNMLIGREYLFGVKYPCPSCTWTNNRWEDTAEIIQP